MRAVDGISFTVEAGEFFGILGPNGAGKTTALEIIEGLREADIDTPAALIRGLDAPVRISVVRGSLHEDAARAIPGVDDATTDASSIVLTTRRAAEVLNHLAQQDTLEGLQVNGATLEDVFLTLTGREYRG